MIEPDCSLAVAPLLVWAGLNRQRLKAILRIQREPLVLRAGDREIRNKGGLPQVLMHDSK